MTAEEKAKAYDEALERANDILKGYNPKEGSKATINYIFPELRESEDEKVRKWLYGYFRSCFPVWIHPDITCEEILAWLENIPYTIDKEKREGFHLGYKAGLEKQGSEPNWCHHKVDLSNCSEEYRKAYYDGWNNCNMQHSQCAWSKEDEKVYQSIIDDTVQENQLDSKQIDWLKSIKSRVQPKQEWSEEDERNLRRAIRTTKVVYPVTADWLKFIKNRITWKPSDEQMKVLDEVLNFAANHESPYWNDYIFETLNNLIRQLKN